MANKDKREAKRAKVAAMSDSFMSGGQERLAFKLPPGLKQFKPEKDKIYNLLFVPYETRGNPAVPDGSLYFERTYHTHPMLGPNKENVLCLGRCFKKKCPACEAVERIYSKPQGELSLQEKDRAKALKAKQRQMFLVVDLDKKEAGVQLLEISNFCFGKHLTAKVARFPAAQQQRLKTFYDPDKPMYLQIGVREDSVEGGKGFPVMSDIEFKEFGKALPEKLMDAAVCLDELIEGNEKAYKYVAKLVHPDGGDEDGEEGDEEKDEFGLGDEDEEKDTGTGEDGDGEEEDGEADEEDAEDAEDDEEGDEQEDEGGEDDGDGDSGGDEDSDGEPEPIAAGDAVTFLVKGVRKSGKVVKVNEEKGRALVLPKGKTEKVWMDVEDLMHADSEPTPKPAEPKKKSKPEAKRPAGKPAGKKPKPKDEEEETDSDDDFNF